MIALPSGAQGAQVLASPTNDAGNTPRPALWEGAPRPPRRWQAEAVPLALAAIREKRRGVVSACTGSGKSVTQAELGHSALQTLRLGYVVLVSVPTESLVEQLAATFVQRCGRRDVGRWYGKVKELKRLVVCCLPSLSTLADELEAKGLKVALWIADECHKAYPDDVQAQVERLAPVTRIGFTATPFRSCKHEYLRGFEEIVYRYTIGDARRDGALVDCAIKRWRGDEVPVDDAMVAMIREHVVDVGFGPGIVSASSIADAEAYAERLTAEGIAALPIHSRLSDGEREHRLRLLRDGRLQCLVHVALLVEGVDLPWLTWLGMRRSTGSPVRVVQEIGRVLRTCEGKRGALVLDPLNILGKIGIRTDAVFEDQAVERLERAMEREAGLVENEGRTKKVPKAVALSDVEAWLADVMLTAQGAGIVQPDSGRFRAGSWRTRAASSDQLRVLGKLAEDPRKSPTRYLPAPARDHVKTLLSTPRALSAGAASDLMSLLFGVKATALGHANRHREDPHPAARYWRWPKDVALPGIGADLIRIAVEVEP